MNNKLILLTLLTLTMSLASNVCHANNSSMINSKLASSVMFPEQNKISTTNVKNIASEKLEQIKNNSMVNPKLASSIIFNEHNNVVANNLNKVTYDGNNGVNDPMKNPMLASSTIFIDQTKFK